MKRRFARLLLLAWLLPALACNLPTAPQSDVRKAVEGTLEAFRLQTAQASLVTPAAPLVTVTPDPGLATEQPALPGVPPPELVGETYHYYTRPGDTLAALALRFGVEPGRILDPQQYPLQALLPAGLELSIPNSLGQSGPAGLLLPDSEIVYGPSAAGFSIAEYVRSAGGFLSAYSEEIDGETLNGAQIVEQVAQDTSTNPRILLAFLEYRSGWVAGSPADPQQTAFPIGFQASGYSGLLKELTLTARQLTIGYYGWRSGKVTEVEFVGGQHQRANPLLNPGSVALQYLFAKLYNPDNWRAELYEPGRFLAFYQGMFGDPWARAEAVEPVLPAGLAQPALELPFLPGETWTLTGGPHAAWGVGSAWGGIDFAPASVEKGCAVSRFLATAAAQGLVARSGRGVVILDLDGDGFEGTGWAILYLHVAGQERVPVGTRINVDDPIGHPSCEGGFATGTHVHLARKYNGEWLAAAGPVPMLLSGWQAWDGEKPYSGALTRGDEIVTARPDDPHTSLITR
jgi:murein DD-endopeptidase MepM/ murein hydrolase activator NlpD